MHETSSGAASRRPRNSHDKSTSPRSISGKRAVRERIIVKARRNALRRDVIFDIDAKVIGFARRGERGLRAMSRDVLGNFFKDGEIARRRVAPQRCDRFLREAPRFLRIVHGTRQPEQVSGSRIGGRYQR